MNAKVKSGFGGTVNPLGIAAKSAAFRVLVSLVALLAVAVALAYLPALVSAQEQSTDATLSALTVNSVSVVDFNPNRENYPVSQAPTVSVVTVAATPTDSAASVVHLT